MVKQNRKTFGFVIGIILMCSFAVLCVAPLIYMVLISFSKTDTLSIDFNIINFRDFSNYRYLFTERSFGRPLLNSIIVVVLSCIGVDALSCTMAYGFEKKPIPGKEAIFSVLLATMMIPTQVIFISLFVIVKELKWFNTYQALIIPLLGAFGVFLMRQFMSGVPDELIEAAEIDGAKEFTIFFNIVLPLVRPALMTLTVFTFNSAWNAFLWPLIATTKSKMNTLTVAVSTLKSAFNSNYGPVMAAATLTFIVPFILYCLLQKEFVEGIALGGVKG